MKGYMIMMITMKEIMIVESIYDYYTEALLKILCSHSSLCLAVVQKKRKN